MRRVEIIDDTGQVLATLTWPGFGPVQIESKYEMAARDWDRVRTKDRESVVTPADGEAYLDAVLWYDVGSYVQAIEIK